MNRCDQEKRLTLFLLGDLSEQEEAEISRHLAGCATCQACAHELEPVLQALSDGLTKDNAKVPRFDLHHQLTLLSVPPESTHQVIDWMARSRPWLVAAASALVVVGLSYFLIFSAMYSRYYTLGTAAAGAAQTQPLTGPSGWLMRHVAPTAGRPYPNLVDNMRAARKK